MAIERDIKYINKEFGDFKTQLTEFAKNYFPDTYNDFSPSSPGTMFIEMAAYVGDVLAFYQDTQLQETFTQYAKDPANLYAIAYMMGYRPKISTVSEVELEVSQLVSATGTGYSPNWDQAIVLGANTVVTATSTGNPKFLITDPVDFNFSSSYDPTSIVIYSVDSGNPAEYILSKKVKAISGVIKTYSETCESAEKFKTIVIEDTDIIGILDITDSDDNKWYEVPYLGQSTVYTDAANVAADRAAVPYSLQLEKVNKRFVTRFTSTGQMQIQFGAGVVEGDETNFLPNPKNVLNNSTGIGINSLDQAYDPSNFLFSKSYGLAPSNTVLTIRYITGGGIVSNAPANTITQASGVTTSATDTSYVNTLTFNNNLPATGGKDGDTVEELRQNALRSFGEQSRAVSLQDYTVRAMSLPPKYGTLAKIYVTQDQSANSTDSFSNPLALALYTLAYDNEGKLTTSSTNLKANLRTYLSQYMLLTDAINLKDAFIINIGVQFEIITLPNFISKEVLLRCTEALKVHFEIEKWSINQPINVSSIFTLLDKVKGVQTVQKIKVYGRTGGNYSEYAYDVEGSTKDNIVYPSYDPMIFEVKYPDIDIQGRVTTL